jgi:hypothetical protein
VASEAQRGLYVGSVGREHDRERARRRVALIIGRRDPGVTRVRSSDLAVDGDRQGRADLAHSGVSKPAESLDEDAERDALD